MPPLVEPAAAVLERRLKQIVRDGPVFSNDGKATMRIETLSGLVADIANEVVKAAEARESLPAMGSA